MDEWCRYLSEMTNGGRLVRIYNVAVQNIVCHGQLANPISIRHLHQLRPKHVTYEPSIFPGARVALNIPKENSDERLNVSVTCYKSGKYVIAGQRDIPSFNRAENAWRTFLKNIKGLRFQSDEADAEPEKKPSARRKRKRKSRAQR